MRYGIFGDVHSNQEAFQEVIAAYKKESIDKYICVGDIVGYGADLHWCIEEVKKLDAKIVCGNHDWASVGLFDKEYFNPLAKEAVLWTEKELSEEEKEFLQSLELVIDEDGFSVVHGSLDRPDEFSYILDIESAYRCFVKMEKNILYGISKFHTTGGARGGAGTPSRGNSGAMRRTPFQTYLNFNMFGTGRIGALRSAIGAKPLWNKLRGAKRRSNLCFIGHSHVPVVFFMEGDKIEYVFKNSIKIEPDVKYIVNVGSVGQPRDRNPKATFSIFDTDKNTIEIKRVDYDIEKAKNKILNAGLPARLGYRLLEGR